MSTALDIKILPKVLTAVNKFGKLVTFIEDGKKTYDPTTGSVVEAGPIHHEHRVIPPEPYDERTLVNSVRSGTSIQIGDCKIGLPASGTTFVPKQGQRVLIDAEHWEIIQVSKVYSGDDVALYYPIQLRR